MLLDNLKNINSVADLFAYICKIEEELENKNKICDKLLVKWSVATDKVRMLEAELAKTNELLEHFKQKAE
jgi:hypothetical protein